MNVLQYKAFISYSHVDEQWAKWIHRTLERYRVPKKLMKQHGLATNRLHPIFRDRDELSTSSSLGIAVTTALAASDNLIVVCSAAAAKSHWVNEEIKTFKALGREERIFCLIVDDADNECFPPALQIDEPLAADVRADADGKYNAKLKIIAGLLNFGFAELKDREQRRRSQFLGLASAASLLVAGVMTALAINAVIAGREAEHSRQLAAKALEDAEAVAGFLSTMLTDLDPEAMGNTIVADLRTQASNVALPATLNGTNTARRILDKHLLEHATQSVTAQFLDQPQIYARLERSIGDSYYAIGLYDQAIKRHKQALSHYRTTLGEGDKRTLEAEGALALAYLFGGRLDDAATTFEHNIQLARKTFDSQHEVVMSAINGLAVTYSDLGRLEEARDLMEEAMQLMVSKYGIDHGEVLEVRGNLAWVLYVLGDYTRAEAINVELLDSKRRVLGPEHNSTLATLNNLALVYRRTGRFDEAEATHREEWAIGRRKLGDDHPDVLITMLNLSRVLSSSNKTEEALSLLLDAHGIAKATLPPYHPLLAAMTAAYGDATLSAGHQEAARTLYLEARRIYEQLHPSGHPRFERLDKKLAALKPAQKT
ncbi:toll/interleukin-1 receptor domain-containing protein [uncultured Paraglaciecola sp.]|uniref:tetratricopeptide repeat protein n=1 Tax=uncultured Paraglaciecola sp. TaxID=1765024 RepID=UPI002631172E|nr:toll/interleukin-1 receptor domain-containing protein [uncultured Paraglaciecola sp.]